MKWVINEDAWAIRGGQQTRAPPPWRGRRDIQTVQTAQTGGEPLSEEGK